MRHKFIVLILMIFNLAPIAIGAEFTKKEGLRRKPVVKEKMATSESLEGLDSFYDRDLNYAKFSGRVTDRDKTANLMKISSENSTVRFFRAGDRVEFNVITMKDRTPCVGHVRSSEDGYFTIYAENLNPCWGESLYFRRGTVLVFDSEDLAKRVDQASLYRMTLLRRKKDFFNQLNKVNHFIWSFDQEKVKVAAKYDEQINELVKQREKAVDQLISKKEDFAKLQRQLAFQIDELKKDLDFYKIERQELFVDRWHLDQDSGVPVQQRPQELRD